VSISYECSDKDCEFKSVGVCPYPISKGRNCLYFIESPCKRCSTEKVQYQSFGSPESRVLIIGGCDYDSQSDVVRSLVSQVSIELNLPVAYYYTTAIKCEVNKKPTITLIKRCNKFIKQEIRIIKPKYVLLMGETAFKAILWDFDLITRRKPEIDACVGSHIIKDGTVYLPVYNLKDIETDIPKRFAFREHLKKFVRLINGKEQITPTYYKEIESEKELVYIKDTAIRTKRISIDIETNELTAFLPNSEITTLSLTVNEAESFCIPLSYRTGAYFKKWNFTPKVNPLLSLLYINDLLKNPNITKIFHNAVFDITWLETIMGVDVINYDDTMIMKFLMNQNEQERKGLKVLLKQYTDIGFYEYALKQYVGEKESFINIPPSVMIEYNSGDTDGTLRLWNLFRPMLRDKQLWDIHYNFMIPKLRGVINLIKTGIALNVPHCIKMKESNENKLVGLYSRLRSIKEVINFERQTNLEFNPGSPKQKFAVVYGGEVKTNIEMSRRIVNGKKTGKKEFQKIVFKDGFNLKNITVLAKTKNGKEQRTSFGKMAIQKYLKGEYKDVEYLDSINTFNLDPLPENTNIMKFIKLTTEINSIQTQLSNHIEPFIGIWGNTIDKCVHTSYDLTGTTTGRLSCIAKGTMIEIVRDVSKFPKGVLIENVKVGDLAYTYDDNNNLCLKKVKWAGKTGYRKCVRVHWKNTGNKSIGELILTPEHKIRLIDKKWKEAQYLKKGDRVLSLSRNTSMGYSVLFAYKNAHLLDHKFILRQVHKEFNKDTHHKVSQELRIGTELAEFYINNNNHVVLSVDDWGYQDVYNLEIEDTHRYIANELTVKNSRSPNLQNLKKEGFVKEAFISRWGKDGILIEADYKQLELFVMAIVSQDPKFVYAFTHGIDLHIRTAANIIFKCSEKDVSEQMRAMAKTINFGVIYGKTAYTLKDDLNVTEEEAEAILDKYFREYPGVYNYCEKVKVDARVKGYVTTVMGRRRYLDYSNPNTADRQAVNTSIQSPASDVCITAINLLQVYYAEIAMQRVLLKTKTSNTNFFLQEEIKKQTVALTCGTVHDSIIVDCKKKYINQILSATKLIMENTALKWLTIPLKVDIKYGKNLREMIKYEGNIVKL